MKIIAFIIATQNSKLRTNYFQFRFYYLLKIFKEVEDYMNNHGYKKVNIVLSHKEE